MLCILRNMAYVVETFRAEQSREMKMRAGAGEKGVGSWEKTGSRAAR